MIKSMTAFAQTRFHLNGVQGTLNMRTYNSRYLDINLRIPAGLNPLEDRFKSFISAHLNRGRVEVSLHWPGPDKPGGQQLVINLPLARRYQELLLDLKTRFHLEGPPTLSDLLSLKDLFFFQEAPRSDDELWEKIRPPLKTTLAALRKMRLAEGRHLGQDLRERLKSIEAKREQILKRAPRVLKDYQDRLNKRIQTLRPGLEVDPQRLAQEVALLADRSDISEELVRLASHLKQFKSLFKEDQPVGKKMEFLLQEINRETNTIGSKSLDSDISHQVVAIKAELEKMREQVQNIE
jgi:uncharacterized protein (TIGR00255 family)